MGLCNLEIAEIKIIEYLVYPECQQRCPLLFSVLHADL